MLDNVSVRQALPPDARLYQYNSKIKKQSLKIDYILKQLKNANDFKTVIMQDVGVCHFKIWILQNGEYQ